jgi:hypothetical protein
MHACSSAPFNTRQSRWANLAAPDWTLLVRTGAAVQQNADHFLCRLIPHLFKLDDQRIFIGELPDLFLGMDELAIDFDIEDPAGTGDESQILDA